MIASLLVALQIAATVPALEIQSTTSSETSGMAAGGSGKSVMTVANGNMKLEQTEHTGPALPGAGAGTYMLMRGAQKKMYSVDPAKKQYYEFDIDKMQAQVGAMLKNMPGMQMKFSKLNSKVEDLGDGEALLGHPTRHYRMTNEMVANATMMSDTLTITMSTTTESYYAKDIKVDWSTMVSGDTAVLSQFRELIPGVDAAKFRESVAKLPRLVPLKSITTTSSHFGPMEQVIKVTQVVTKVDKKQVPASIFEIPAGYKKVEMPSLAGPERQ
ncbi:MAG TPA: hypothetical protein VF042_07085 [Gemmatimonadaceae bacterium]